MYVFGLVCVFVVVVLTPWHVDGRHGLLDADLAEMEGGRRRACHGEEDTTRCGVWMTVATLRAHPLAWLVCGVEILFFFFFFFLSFPFFCGWSVDKSGEPTSEGKPKEKEKREKDSDTN